MPTFCHNTSNFPRRGTRLLSNLVSAADNLSGYYLMRKDLEQLKTRADRNIFRRLQPEPRSTCQEGEERKATKEEWRHFWRVYHKPDNHYLRWCNELLPAVIKCSAVHKIVARVLLNHHLQTTERTKKPNRCRILSEGPWPGILTLLI
jgi:hypothetical protein